MSLETFIKQKKEVPSLITDFAKRKNNIIDFQTIAMKKQGIPVETEIKEEKKKLTTWQWISKQLMKPVGTVAAEVEQLGKFMGTGITYTPGKAGLEVLSGKRENSFSKIWGTYSPSIGISENIGRKIGFVFDIADDPLNFIGGGLTKIGRIAQKVTSLTKAGKTIKVGSKLAKIIAKYGYTMDDLVLAGSKIAQAQKGQRAFLQLFSKTIIKGEKIYGATAKLKTLAGISKLGVGLRRTFTTKTGVKDLDILVDNFKNLSTYRKQQVLDKAIDIQKTIKKMPSSDIKLMAEVIENPTIRNKAGKNILKVADDIDEMFKGMKITERAKGVLKTELENYFPHIKAKEAFGERIKYFFNPKKYSAALGAAKHRKITGTVSEINARFGKEFFESNPALAYAQRGLASAKAVTAREFLDEAGKQFFMNAEDAPLHFIESTNPIFKGLKAEPEIIRTVDQYIQGIQPDDLKLIIRGFDRVQNWWKGQVLISPSYHLRNTISNFWNNWLAGVKDPTAYHKARLVQSGKKLNQALIKTDAGEILTRGQILKLAKERRVMGKGWYGTDIAQSLADEVGGLSARAQKLKKLMPWEQNNILFKTNRAVGEAIEDNARLAHFIDKLRKGFSADDAARSVKKFLFDYDDLSKTEKTIFKRIIPFYTWTRKNIPLQLENMIIQPEKYAAIPKLIQQIEAGVAEPKTEKYMSQYITENVPVRIRTNKEGNTEYFLLGNWLPSAQAIDFLSQPFTNIINMATPLFKTPYEIWANKSLFFRNTLGEASKIEYYYKQSTEFVGIDMRRKATHLLRNIRILNDLDKLIETPAKDEPENSWTVKLLNVLFGKAATYNIEISRYFYRRETEERVQELEAGIKKAAKDDNKERVKKLQEELKEFRKKRKL